MSDNQNPKLFSLYKDLCLFQLFFVSSDGIMDNKGGICVTWTFNFVIVIFNFVIINFIFAINNWRYVENDIEAHFDILDENFI